jgi:hypothetical protein
MLWPVVSAFSGDTKMGITYHQVPNPGIEKRILTDKQAIEGHGWDDLGKRNPKFIALHRMLGNLWGTDQYFRDPDVASLTDFGIGIAAIDGAANAGKILQWNDYHGFRSGWASGRVSNPYGDGAKIVAKYGIDVVNRDGVSVEISGYYDDAIDDASWKKLVALCAYLADEMEVPYTSLPINPHTGINLLIWHQEFTIGTGKICPGLWVMNNTDRLYKDIAAYLKPYQEGSVVPEPVPPAQRTFTLRFDTYLRTTPGFWDTANNKTNVIKLLKAGVTGEVIEGPKAVDGVDFYNLKIVGQGVDGTGWLQDQVLHTLAIERD